MSHPATGESAIGRIQPAETHDAVSSRMYADAQSNLGEVQHLSQQAHVNPSGETADMLNGFELTALHENNPAQNAQAAPLDALAGQEHIGPAAGGPGVGPEQLSQYEQPPQQMPGAPPELQQAVAPTMDAPPSAQNPSAAWQAPPEMPPDMQEQAPPEAMRGPALQPMPDAQYALAPAEQLPSASQPPMGEQPGFSPYEMLAPQMQLEQPAMGAYAPAGDTYPPYQTPMDAQDAQTPWNTQIYNPFQAMQQIEQGLLGGPGTDGPMGVLAPSDGGGDSGDNGDYPPAAGSYDGSYAPPLAEPDGGYDSDDQGGY